jgi:hypothetical protein
MDAPEKDLSTKPPFKKTAARLNYLLNMKLELKHGKKNLMARKYIKPVPMRLIRTRKILMFFIITSISLSISVNC